MKILLFILMLATMPVNADYAYPGDKHIVNYNVPEPEIFDLIIAGIAGFVVFNLTTKK
jgi:hypothetical protein